MDKKGPGMKYSISQRLQRYKRIITIPAKPRLQDKPAVVHESAVVQSPVVEDKLQCIQVL